MEPIKIKCPSCGGLLSLKTELLNFNINVICPICKISSPLKSYKRIKDNLTQDYTEYPDSDDVTRMGVDEKNGVVGQLNIQGTACSSFVLKMGRNVVGRMAKSSTADIQIPIQTEERSRTSREHLVVDVAKVCGKGVVHYLSLYPKARINETLLNGEKLSGVDRIPLKHGDIIALPDINLIFEIPDEEETVIQ